MRNTSDGGDVMKSECPIISKCSKYVQFLKHIIKENRCNDQQLHERTNDLNWTIAISGRISNFNEILDDVKYNRNKFA